MEQSEEDNALDIIVVQCLVLVVGALGNGLVIWATGFKLKKTMNAVWFLNLAVADLLYIAFLPLAVMHEANDWHWPLGKFMCKLRSTVDHVAIFASVYVLVVMSVDRCVSVVWPVWVQNCRGVRTASCVSVGVWVLALVLSSPHFIFMDSEPDPYVENRIECGINFSNFSMFSDEYESPAVVRLRQFREQAMTISYFLLGYGVPLAIIVSCYAVIIHRLRRNRSPAGHSQGRPFRTTAAVIASFFLCFAPYQIMKVIYGVAGKLSDIDVVFYAVAACLASLYRCLNLLLYVLMGQNFKKKHSILKVLERAFTEEEPPPNPSTNLSLSDAQ